MRLVKESRNQVSLSRRRSLLGLGLAGFSLSLCGISLADDIVIFPARKRARLVRMIAEVKNPHEWPAVDQMLWVYLPVAETCCYHLTNIEVTSRHSVIHDALRQTVLSVPLAAVPPLSTKIITVTVELADRPSPCDESNFDMANWLDAQRYIESTNQEIISLAKTLRGPSARNTARNIYSWAAENISYSGYLSSEMGAAYALRERRGDCTEFADLTAALCRANGIPARTVCGYVVSGDALLRSQDYHNWTEVYVDGGWNLLDAQKLTWTPSDCRYIPFHYCSPQPLNPIGMAQRFSSSSAIEINI